MHQQLLALSEELGGPLLALETSAAQAAVCTVAWLAGRVEEFELPAASMPSESLAPAIAAARDRAELELSRLKAIVIGLGPGSYTGLRVGLATAKGLAFGAGVPVYGVSSLAVLAASCGSGLVAPVLESRVGEVFGALYDVADDGGVRALVEDAAYLPERLAEVIASAAAGDVRLVGSGATACAQTLSSAEVIEARVRAGCGLRLAGDRMRAGDAEDLATLAPLYLRLSEAERRQPS